MIEFKDYNQYQLYLDNNYNEDQQITIENFISYYQNKDNGFGHLNCEIEYQDELKNDIDNLHKIAIIGFNLLKKNKLKRNKKIFII